MFQIKIKKEYRFSIKSYMGGYNFLITCYYGIENVYSLKFNIKCL